MYIHSLQYYEDWIRTHYFNRSHWNEITSVGWQTFSSPWRPSVREVSVYKKFIDKIKPRSVLVLGSTPEIRDILATLEEKVVISDFSLHMIQQMSELMKTSKRFEVWQVENWLNITRSENMYDLVIGDLTLRLIDFNKQEKLLEIICKILKKNGSCILREHYVDNTMYNISFEKLSRELYNICKLTLSLDKKSDLIMSLLFDSFIDRKHHRVDEGKLYSYLRQTIEKTSGRNHDILQYTFRKWGTYFNYTQLTKNELEQKFNNIFEMHEIYQYAENYRGSFFYPIYWLKKV